MQKLLCLPLLCIVFGAQSSIQELELPQVAVKDDAALAEAMPGFAKRVIAIYEEPDPNRQLNALFRLQMVAGQYAESVVTLRSLAELRRATNSASALPLLPALRGYNIDPVAQIDTPEITYQWMDYVMRGGKKPELLKDKINYQVMGANEWKHAPSMEKLSNETLTLYLTDKKSGAYYQLSKEKPSTQGFLSQEVDFANRKTTNNDSYPYPIVGKKPDLSNGFSFITEPFDEPVEISGAFLGEIKATINKKDMDIGVVLYEVMPDGELFHLSYFIGRASYAKDMSVRKLLTPGKVESIPFDRTRMVSRRLGKGSRMLVTLNVNKNPYAQINYGTGKDVSDEDINDAKPPLQIKWHNDSYVKIPIWK
jgi:uncharacterized protein